jgi:hypothetical protein
MPRGFIWLLLIVGFLLLLVGGATTSIPLLVIGIAMIGVGLFIGLRPGGILSKEEVIDNWSTLIENAHGKAEEVFNGTQGFLDQSKAPNLKIERRKLAPGFLRGLLGVERDFLVVVEHANPRLGPYQVFLNARDYGISLAIDWHLTFRPSIWQALASLLPGTHSGRNPLVELDLFDQQDLRAYTTNCHHCLLKSVDSLMLSLSQDPSKIDRKSRGFLGIS